MFFSKALLGSKKKVAVINYITDVRTVRGNNYILDNSNKKITVYKKLTASGSVYNMDFLLIFEEGYTAERPDGIGTAVNSGITYWRSSTTNNNSIQKFLIDIVDSEGNIVATYELILDWTTEG